MRTQPAIIPALALAAVLGACGGGEKKTESAPAVAPAAAATAGTATPCTTCKVIVVTMKSEGTGNFFEPAEFEAHEGDVIRFTLGVGVHNAHFLPDSNPGKSNLPPASDLLQLPGQTWDVPLTFGTGKFYFQCDPHAALGMKGHVKVEKKD